MFRRLLGLIILLATLVVLAVLIATAYYFGPVMDQVGTSVDNGLALSVETLETVMATLTQTEAVLVSVNDTMDTAAQTTLNLSTTIADTIPLLEQVAVVVSDQLPANVEAIQASVPNIAAVATVVDNTLTRLSAFEINQTIPIPFNPIQIQYDLGIEYNPEEPFGDSIEQLGTSLEGLPEELRSLRGELEVSAANLEILSADLDTASGDIEAINAELANFIPLLEQYVSLLDRVITGVKQTRADVANNLEMIKLVGTVLPIALALTQLAPLVVGWDLLTARNKPQVIVKEVEVQPSGAVGETVDIKETEEQAAQNESEDTLS
jgi:ABC-type transporter Mla subunit MlaD